MEICKHMAEIKDVKPSSYGCLECLKTGSSWMHLRICMMCGHVGCCDSSPNQHATRHFHETKHAIMFSFEPGEHWAWCFEDELLMELPRDHEALNSQL
jgi:uncharacterized UBP type Zn finger protein